MSPSCLLLVTAAFSHITSIMARRGYGPHFKVQTSVLVTFTLLKLIFTTDIPPDEQTHREALFYSMRTTSLMGNVTSIKLVKNELECAFMCLRNYPRSCLSFNFGGNLSSEMRSANSAILKELWSHIGCKAGLGLIILAWKRW